MVSICIPAYENPLSLKRLLDSLSNQTYQEYEVIVTDDSTTSQVEDVVDEFIEGNQQKEIFYYRNESRLGPTDNTIAAVSYAKGKYIKIMHHDDYFQDNDSLEKLIKLIESEDAAISFCGTYETEYDENNAVISSDSRCISEIEEAQLSDNIENLFLVNMIGAPSATLIRHDLLINNSITMDSKLKWLVDIDYYINILNIKPKYAYTKEPLINIGRMATQVTKECLADQELIFNETKYVFIKYRLAKNERHIRYICNIGNKINKKYKDYSETGISFLKYCNYRFRYVIRKMFGKL